MAPEPRHVRDGGGWRRLRLFARNALPARSVGDAMGLRLISTRVAVCVLAAISLLGCGDAATVGGNRPPNVVLIVVDDVGLGQVGAYAPGSAPGTPQIDRIARAGAVFTNAYVAAPSCRRSRASILLGRYYQRVPNVDDISRRYSMISQYMKAAGYATAYIGKWHQGFDAANHPQAWGFDSFFGFLGGLHDYWTSKPGLSEFRQRIAEARRPSAIRAAMLHSPILDGHEEVHEFDYLTREFSRRAVAFIDASNDAPFFLHLAYNAIHTPFQGPDADESTGLKLDPVEQLRVVDRMLEELDVGVGRVLDALERNGLSQRTLVLFVSDNGAMPMIGAAGVNGALRGAKGDATEGGIRVPFMLAWPGTVAGGQEIDALATTIDFLPTIIAAAGIDPADRLDWDGVDLMPLVDGRGAPAPDRALYFGDTYFGWHAMRQGRWKLLRRRSEDAWALYDLSVDPGESEDVSSNRPGVVARMSEAWGGWWSEMGASRSLGVE